MNKKEYLSRLDEQKKIKKLMKDDKYLLNFHLIPPSGWLNDPNGLCEFKGINHIYYQYTPFSAEWGMKLWGHYTTEDWITYKDEEPFLFPDITEDKDGVYSGSAFIKDNKIYFYYTGNVKYIDKKYNYISDGREQNTILIKSKDGFSYKDKKVLLKNIDYPKDMSCHIRDPQIFEKQENYYMVLGGRDLNNTGCVLIYHSKDLENWNYHMKITTPKKFGYMWECPNLIEISGQLFLICCPQGIEQDGINYANIYQCGYFPLEIDFEKKEYKIGKFIELDRGFDIYAPQVFTDEEGRKILLGWMGIPDSEYTNKPTVEHKWQHALTLPRELKVIKNKIYQTPLKELTKLRVKENKEIICNSENVEINFSFKKCTDFKIELRDSIELNYKNNILTLNLEKCGYGRKERKVYLETLESLQIFLDNSSIEIFVNSGAEVFTSRCYCDKLNSNLKFIGNYILKDFVWYDLKKFKIESGGR